MNIEEWTKEFDAKLKEIGTEGLKAYFDQFRTKPLEPLIDILDMLNLPFKSTADGSIVLTMSKMGEKSLDVEFFPNGELVLIKRNGEHREYDEWTMCPELADALAITAEPGEELA